MARKPKPKAAKKTPSRATQKPAAKKPAPAPKQSARSKPGSTASLRAFCRSLPGATEDIKWEDHLMFCVGAKIFAGFGVDESDDSFGFKCDDDDYNRLTELGERNADSIIPAPYAARFGWVKVMRAGALPDAELRALLRKSYDLVAAKLPKRLRPPQ